MRLTVGRIAKPHGIRGEVIVEVRTDDPGARFAAGSVLFTDPAAVPRAHKPVDQEPRGVRWSLPPALTIEAARPHQGVFIVQFDGVYDRSVADELRGVLLSVDSAEVSTPDDPDEFNDHDLIGLVAVDVHGEQLGEIVRVDHPPAADLLVLRRPGGRNALVPFVRAIVPEVDVAAGRVVLTPPEGLLDL